MTQFRLGLIGAGRMGRVHLRALSASDAVRVVAVAEPAEAARVALGDAGVTLHASVAEMLQTGALDGVLVAAPSTQHLALVAQVAAAGLPILCEKPCGITASQARQAAVTAARHRVKLQVAYWRRFVPALQRLRQRIADDELGALYFLACYQWDGEPPPPQFHAGSGGIFVDMGVHEFDQISLAEQPGVRPTGFRCRPSLRRCRRCRKRAGAVHVVHRQHGLGVTWPALSARRRLPRGSFRHARCRGLPVPVAARW